jgi:hypothetical protein
MNYAELQQTIAAWLNRGDLEDVIPTFISDAEARLNRDRRVRLQSARTTVTIGEDEHALPADYRELDSWYHDGPTFYGPIEVVDGNALPLLKARHGRTGPPQFAAIMDRKAYFAPEPDGEYETRMSFWRRVPPLTDGDPENWFLDAHPDIYRLAALAESAPYLMDDERLTVWEAQLDARLEDFWRSSEAERFSGSLVRRMTPIGG